MGHNHKTRVSIAKQVRMHGIEIVLSAMKGVKKAKTRLHQPLPHESISKRKEHLSEEVRKRDSHSLTMMRCGRKLPHFRFMRSQLHNRWLHRREIKMAAKFAKATPHRVAQAKKV